MSETNKEILYLVETREHCPKDWFERYKKLSRSDQKIVNEQAKTLAQSKLIYMESDCEDEETDEYLDPDWSLFNGKTIKYVQEDPIDSDFSHTSDYIVTDFHFTDHSRVRIRTNLEYCNRQIFRIFEKKYWKLEGKNIIRIN